MSKEIKIVNLDGVMAVSSRVVAKDFSKEHYSVTRAIENLTLQNCGVKEMFIEGHYEHNGNTYKEYLMNRDGFSLLVMGFTGKEALEWKVKYIEAFNKMEQMLKQTPMTIEDMMIHQLNETKKMKGQIETIETTIRTLPLQTAECDRVTVAVKRKAFEFIGEKNSYAYENCYGKVIKNIYSLLKYHFGVKSYKQIERNKLGEALKYIEEIKLPIKLKDEIEDAKTQGRMEMSY